ncbi:MAG: DNA alkylation repair protein [Rickettsiales bacterium]|jgi:3-methyladenine DNA glycosylase AlkD|nr:DNA alkylation repair protein [Rickettsiales bacterium]
MLQEILNKLKKAGDPKIAASSGKFFKEPVNLYGLKYADTKSILKEYLPLISKMEKKDVFALYDALLADNHLESGSIAAEFAYHIRNKFEKSDFQVFDKWVKEYITNWTNCDVLCNHSVNALIEMYPELMPDIKRWSKSKNRWVKCASAVTFILSAHQGHFLDDVFEIAETLLTDPDDMVQKGYGWALKAAGEFDPKRVFDFLTKRVDKMPRTAYRYAIEKLPTDMRKDAMAL